MFERKLDPQRRPQGAAPAGEILRRLAIDRVEGHQLRPAFGSSQPRDFIGERAERGEAAITETQHGKRGAGRGVQRREAVDEPLRRGGSLSLAPGGGENDEPFGLRIARQLETGHWRDMNMLARCGQRMLERRSETPGAAALRAHQQDGPSAFCRMIATETRP